jgi:glycosyltransferase involved in cell wall biosynthesis
VPAFTSLAERHGELELTVLGAGVPEEVVRAAFPERVRVRVSCARAADEAETAGWFARSDIYVLPSLFEGTPLTLLEAMASGLPVVTTATCGMKDVVRDGETGLFIAPRSPGEIVAAVERLMGDARLRERLGRAAQKEAAEKYTWERVAEPVAEVYERLCAARQRA